MFARASKKLGLDQAVFNTFNQADGPDKEEVDALLRVGAYGARSCVSYLMWQECLKMTMQHGSLRRVTLIRF